MGEKETLEENQRELRQAALIRSAYHMAYLTAFRDLTGLVLFSVVLVYLVSKT